MRHAVVILAAGLGRRLGMPDGVPKWLAPVGDHTPAGLHLAACARTATVAEVVVVAGHGRLALDEAVAAWRDRLALRVVDNPHHGDRNNWYSLLVGLDAVMGAGGGAVDGVVVVNSDLCAPVEWFVTLLDSVADVSGDAVLAVDFERPLTDEAMKVALDEAGRLQRIAKVGVPDPHGEYVGLTFLRPQAAAGLRVVLRDFLDDPSRVDAWYEHGIQAHADAGACYRAIAVPHGGWVEIDDPADLVAATEVMATSR